MLLLIDNYDSFTYNLAQYLGELGQKVRVERNDAIDIAAIAELAQSGHAMEFLKDQYRHCKTIMLLGEAETLLEQDIDLSEIESAYIGASVARTTMIERVSRSQSRLPSSAAPTCILSTRQPVPPAVVRLHEPNRARSGVAKLASSSAPSRSAD